MINKPLYDKTVQILFDAYFNDTLKHGNCHACAVGNIVAANMGFQFETVANDVAWQGVTDNYATWYSAVYCGRYEISPWTPIEAIKQIKSTGYTGHDLAKIEYAFETADKGTSDDEEMFQGLCNVLEVLKQIHQIENDEPVRQKFNDHYLSIAK